MFSSCPCVRKCVRAGQRHSVVWLGSRLSWIAVACSAMLCNSANYPVSLYCQLECADGMAYGATENASTENESTGGWNMQVRNT